MRKQREDIRRRILFYLEEEQLFLKSSLSLTELSLVVGTNTTSLTWKKAGEKEHLGKALIRHRHSGPAQGM